MREPARDAGVVRLRGRRAGAVGLPPLRSSRRAGPAEPAARRRGPSPTRPTWPTCASGAATPTATRCSRRPSPGCTGGAAPDPGRARCPSAVSSVARAGRQRAARAPARGGDVPVLARACRGGAATGGLLRPGAGGGSSGGPSRSGGRKTLIGGLLTGSSLGRNGLSGGGGRRRTDRGRRARGWSAVRCTACGVRSLTAARRARPASGAPPWPLGRRSRRRCPQATVIRPARPARAIRIAAEVASSVGDGDQPSRPAGADRAGQARQTEAAVGITASAWLPALAADLRTTRSSASVARTRAAECQLAVATSQYSVRGRVPRVVPPRLGPGELAARAAARR